MTTKKTKRQWRAHPRFGPAFMRPTALAAPQEMQPVWTCDSGYELHHVKFEEERRCGFWLLLNPDGSKRAHYQFGGNRRLTPPKAWADAVLDGGDWESAPYQTLNRVRAGIPHEGGPQ